ncbi:flagellar hook protein FlgE [Crenalkalicoccus roseus]|uniref:flagellar hook protein FlgE n=1 Tax=Crenalkalicoccus roseus TaxID=1485588 RepID=UPI00108099B5|nr:flagellar hook protein FlgE [Crenalkalicoccus roseus]
MSLFGSLTTAISGLTAQSRALGHVSDNVANSQTIGFKRTDTNFVNYLTHSSNSAHMPGAVIARPDYTNGIQGIIEQSEEPLAMAIGGQGFFSVAAARGVVNGRPVFDDRQFFTRAGDFRLDKDGYMVNGSGYYLQGWPSDQAGNPDRTTLEPIQVTQQVFNPIATSRIELAANLPADPTAGPVRTQAQVYDSLGRRFTVDLDFTPVTGTPNAWDLNLRVPGNVGGAAAEDRGTVRVVFNSNAAPPIGDGTIADIFDAGAAGTITPPASNAPRDPAELSFTADFGQGPQTIRLNLGAFGVAQGLTQYAGREFAVRNLAQDGVPLGSYAGLTMRETGDVVVNYDNGQSRVIARVPLVAFSDPDKLQRLDGQAFMRTVESGEARVTDPSSNGVGKLITGSVERSNVDIANEFTKLIVAQRAYTANTRIVSASDEMLQDTINMRR